MQFDRLKRRELITLLGSVAVWPAAARAQQQGKLPTIGYFSGATPAAESQRGAVFVQRLRELGWIEGRTVTIEYRWAEGRTERFAEIAAEFVRLKVDVIVATGTPPALSAKQATSVIPIVFVAAADPLGTGLVESLARPGGNITGLSSQFTDIVGKRLELLRGVVPGLRRLAIMGNIGNPAIKLELGEVQAAARTFGLETAILEIRRSEDIAPVFEALKGRAEALYVATDLLIVANRIRINTLALNTRLPTTYNSREYVELGGLMSYGPKLPGLVPARRRFCRKDSARGEAARHSGRAADQIRFCHQSDDRQGARHRRG